jgi:hypothetical protein
VYDVLFTELCSVGTLTYGSNHFVALAGVRAIVVAGLVLLTWEFLLLVFVTRVFGTKYCVHHSKCRRVLCSSWSFAPTMLSAERVPFDVVEAESELMDGVSVDVGAGVFSVLCVGTGCWAVMLETCVTERSWVCFCIVLRRTDHDTSEFLGVQHIVEWHFDVIECFCCLDSACCAGFRCCVALCWCSALQKTSLDVLRYCWL